MDDILDDMLHGNEEEDDIDNSISGPEDGEVSTHDTDTEPEGDSEDSCLPPLMSCVRQKSEGKETLKKEKDFGINRKTST